MSDAGQRRFESVGPNGLLAVVVLGAAGLFWGTFYALTAYGPTTTEPATVVRQYVSSSTASRSVCGIEVQLASGEKTKASGGNVCAAYDEGDQAVALVSTLTGDAVGVRHAGRDLGRTGNPLVGSIPILALLPLVSGLREAERRGQPSMIRLSGAAVAGAAAGVLFYLLAF